VLEGLRMLEDDSLGGGGSRGSGRVRFANLKLTWRGQGYYATGAAQKDLGAGVDLASLQTGFREAALSFLREE
jgi:CRISPR-associated protein Csm3